MALFYLSVSLPKNKQNERKRRRFIHYGTDCYCVDYYVFDTIIHFGEMILVTSRDARGVLSIENGELKMDNY